MQVTQTCSHYTEQYPQDNDQCVFEVSLWTLYFCSIAVSDSAITHSLTFIIVVLASPSTPCHLAGIGSAV